MQEFLWGRQGEHSAHSAWPRGRSVAAPEAAAAHVAGKRTGTNTIWWVPGSNSKFYCESMEYSWWHRSFYFQWQNLNPRRTKVFLFLEIALYWLFHKQDSEWIKACHSIATLGISLPLVKWPTLHTQVFLAIKMTQSADCISQKAESCTQAYFDEKHYFAALQVLQDYIKRFLIKQ